MSEPKPKSKKKSQKKKVHQQFKEQLVDDDVLAEAHKNILKVGDGSVGRKINFMMQSCFRILYVRSPEESRVINFFRNLSKYRGHDLSRWDCDRGFLDGLSEEKLWADESELHENPVAALAKIVDDASSQEQARRLKKHADGHIYLLLDFHMFLTDMPNIDRKLKQFAGIVSTSVIVIIAPVFVCPPTIEKLVTLIDFPCPSGAEIKEVLYDVVDGITHKLPKLPQEAEENEEDLVKAASGLTLTEAGNAYSMSVVQKKTFDVQTILDEKKQMISKGGILEYCDPRFTMDDLGGLDNLKKWLKLRRLAFSDDARAFGLPIPRGTMFFGVPGTGKSLCCEALAHEYAMPLLRLDFGAIFASHIGESEENIRTVLNTADAVAPCILWCDEIEKGMGGTGSGSTDGGVANRVFGTMLTWMQDKTSPVFVVCTANDVLNIPPEFMRAGRFDEVFFIDIPNTEQRYDVLEKLLKRKDRDPKDFDLDAIVDASPNYTPVEIEKGIDNALFVAYSDGKRELRSDDIVSEIQKFYPLYNSRKEEVTALREWALGKEGHGGRAILANSSPKTKKTVKKHMPRAIELDI